MGASVQLVREYFRRARATAVEAENATGQELKRELRHLAEQWEALARARLELLGHQPVAPVTPTNESSERTPSTTHG